MAADLVSHHKHAQRHQFRIAEVPNFLLQRNAGPKFLDAVTGTELDRVGGQACFPSWDTQVFSDINIAALLDFACQAADTSANIVQCADSRLRRHLPGLTVPILTSTRGVRTDELSSD